MLTIFSAPKPFVGHIDIIQRNAIRTWSHLHPPCEIVLCGDDPGVGEAAAQFGARHIRDVARNEYATPLINSIFARAQLEASHRLMCYVNADIILLDDFMEAVRRIRMPRFLMVGQRWNLHIEEPLAFDGPDWARRLARHAHQDAVLEPRSGIDYFVFPRGMLGELPSFAVGRPGWDNWLIYRARAMRLPVIDATRVTTVIHQNHHYRHVPAARGTKYEGPEADRNREMIGSWDHFFTIADATHMLTRRALLPALSPVNLLRRWQTLPTLRPGLRPLLQPFDKLARLIAGILRFFFRLLQRRRGAP